MTGAPPDQPIRTPVLIAGGGPVGLATAMELAHHGIECVVIEPRTTVSATRPRAKTTSARTMELFRRWPFPDGRSFADEIRRRAPLPVGWSSDIAFCTTATGREVTRFTGVLGLDLVASHLAAEPGQLVGQPVVEQALRDALAACPRVRVLYGWRVVSVRPDADSVSGTLVDESGQAIDFEANYVVGADGARSTVRAAMGVRYEGGNAGRPNLSIVFRSPTLAGHLAGGPAVHYWVLNPAAPGVVGPLDLAGAWWAIAAGPTTTVTPIRSRSCAGSSAGTSRWRCSAPTRGRREPCWPAAIGPAGCSWPGTPRTRIRPGAGTVSTPASGTR